MKIARQEDEQRFWVNEGLAQFSQLVRQHQASLPKLCEEATRFLSHYLDAQQGCLYIRNDENEDNPFLELTSGYAFENKKNNDRRINIGDGLLGQAFVDGEPLLLTDVPPKHVEIASGLGHAAPSLSVHRTF